MNQKRIGSGTRPLLQAALLLTGVLLAANAAVAAVTDIAQVPLVTSSATVVKPNLLLILDDSGSMANNYMPDDANFSSSKYGFYAAQCNGLAYNPAITYAVPVTSTGTPYADVAYVFPSPTALSNQRSITSVAPTIGTGSFTVTLGGSGSYSTGTLVTMYSGTDTTKLMVGTVTAWNSSTKALTVNVTEVQGSGTLSSPQIGNGDNRSYYYNYTGSQIKLGYTYTASGVITSTTFYQECNSNTGSTPGSSVFTKVVVTPYDSAATLKNYGNWQAYYSTRILMMRSSASIAFQPITDKYRVGFTTISSTSVDGSKFLDVADFNASQKALFYSQIFAASPSSYTPLRGALSKAGHYFANKGTKANGTAQTYDPMQYSCQRNYAIMTTDGYWNTHDETSSYGPYKLDGTNVGEQDGAGTPRPMLDGASALVQSRTSTLQSQTITPQWTKGTSQLQTWSITPQWTTGTSQLQQRTITPQWTTGTSTLQKLTGQLQSRTSTNSGSTWTAWANTSSCTWDTTSSSRTQCQYVWGTPSNVSSCTVAYSTTTSNGTVWSGNGTKCQYSTPINTTTSSCTPVAASPGPTNYTVGTAVTCTDATLYGSWTNTASCTTSTTLGCQYAAPVNTTTTSCTPVAASAGSPYTVGTAVTCTALAPLLGTKSNVSTCTASPTVGCGYAAPVSTTVTSCTAVPASTGPTNYPVGTAVTCTSTTPLYGSWTSAASCTTSSTQGCQYTAWSAWSYVASCTLNPQSAGPNYTVGTATDCQTLSSGGSTDTLADVAMYYYQTDLRTTALGNCTATVNGNPIDVCANNVSPSGSDDANWQHMTTFTLGLGVSGMLRYTTDYLTATSGDFHDIVQGTKDWPVPTADQATAVDDLWHAAVDGRGRYFTAGDPLALAQSLNSALASIDAKAGSGSGAAASTLQPVAGDNQLFIAKYKSVYWNGDLVARTIDPVTGVISAPVWSAAAQLQATAPASRTIYYFKRANSSANTGTLRPFTYSNLTTDGLNGLFDNACSKSPALTQCSTSGFATATANSGSNMVDFLRGGSNSVYRTRVTGDADIPGGILGDVIGGAPVYVRKPSFSYTENNYAGFVATVNASNAGAGRPGVVYVASNDGMLHAFDGNTGNEKWAYVPSMVMGNMYILADADYADRHQYLVNGAPVVGDIYVPGSPGAWKTILVGGLGGGGRGYYALDITDPNNPQALWEFTNDTVGGNNNLGLTFGNPVITKRADGTWVVVFSSGYNNVSPGDGNGHLFMVNANTGTRLLDIPTYTDTATTIGTTPAGTGATPSGLGKINAWVDSTIDNTATRFYGGDLLGNLWRFDTDHLVVPNQAALRLAYFNAGGSPEAITTQPSLALVNYAGSTYPVVYVGTGKYLGTTDLANTAQQAVYAIKDPLTATPLGDAHASSSVVAQTLSQASANAAPTITNLAVDWSTQNGWRVDLLNAGERVNVDMQLLNNTLTFASNIPSVDVCSSGGLSYLYQLDIGTGSTPSAIGGNVAGKWLGGTMVVGISWVTLELSGGAAGSGQTVTITIDNTGTPRVDAVPPPSPPTATGRRTSWRELVN
jgi:type IV pilus assembly protein PilY1